MAVEKKFKDEVQEFHPHQVAANAESTMRSAMIRMRDNLDRAINGNINPEDPADHELFNMVKSYVVADLYLELKVSIVTGDTRMSRQFVEEMKVIIDQQI